VYEENTTLKLRRPLGFVNDILSQQQQITRDKVVHTSNANMERARQVIRMDSKVHDKSIHLRRFLPAKHNKHGVVPPELPEWGKRQSIRPYLGFADITNTNTLLYVMLSEEGKCVESKLPF
jgi:hypothetical protein